MLLGREYVLVEGLLERALVEFRLRGEESLVLLPSVLTAVALSDTRFLCVYALLERAVTADSDTCRPIVPFADLDVVVIFLYVLSAPVEPAAIWLSDETSP